MEQKLTAQERADLQIRHKKEHDKRVCDCRALLATSKLFWLMMTVTAIVKYREYYYWMMRQSVVTLAIIFQKEN
jgi:hypothetical protein